MLFKSYMPAFWAALKVVLPKLSGQVLENRGTTIGASDVAGCALRVILGKRYPEKHNRTTQMRFLSGHSREVALDWVHDEVMAQQGWFLHSQTRVEDVRNPRIRAHVDRMIADAPALEDASIIHILEEKNPEDISPEPKQMNLRQLQFQMGLSAERYPKAVIFGSILETDHCAAQEFGPYELDLEIYDELQERARQMLWVIDQNLTPEPEPGMECAWCRLHAHCPIWRDKLPEKLPEEIVAALREHAQCCRDKKAAEKRQKALGKEIQKALWGDVLPRRFKGKVAPGLWIDLGTRNGRKSVSVETLETEYPEVAEAVVTTGKDYKVFSVREDEP